MNTSPIPVFDIHGVVPPIRPGHHGDSPERSPYQVDLLTFFQRFGSSQHRRLVLKGLLELRAELHLAGKSECFQWIDGSFLEDLEVQRGRAPDDVDVVTFMSLDDAPEQIQLCESFPDVVYRERSKQRFKVDHFLLPTDVPYTIDYASNLACWYALWSHRRDDLRWKGFVAIPLVSNDNDARAWLRQYGEAPPDGGGTT
jgi:hypothetical protein